MPSGSSSRWRRWFTATRSEWGSKGITAIPPKTAVMAGTRAGHHPDDDQRVGGRRLQLHRLEEDGEQRVHPPGQSAARLRRGIRRLAEEGARREFIEAVLALHRGNQIVGGVGKHGV